MIRGGRGNEKVWDVEQDSTFSSSGEEAWRTQEELEECGGKGSDCIWFGTTGGVWNAVRHLCDFQRLGCLQEINVFKTCISVRQASQALVRSCVGTPQGTCWAIYRELMFRVTRWGQEAEKYGLSLLCWFLKPIAYYKLPSSGNVLLLGPEKSFSNS